MSVHSERALATVHYRDHLGSHTLPFYGDPWNRYHSRDRAVYLYSGTGHGVDAVIAGWDMCGALDDIDEDHTGRHVDPADRALDDYPGETLADRITAAMEDGDIRCNGGGTLAWVDPHETMLRFDNAANLLRYLRGDRT